MRSISRSGEQRRNPRGGLTLLVTVTLNPNQLRSHLLPILDLPEVESVVLVADEPAPVLPKLRSIVPPAGLVRVLGRAGAKLVVCTRTARRERPDWVIGYNLVPHGINAYIAGKASKARVMYQQIGGSVEWEGGGWNSDNAVLGRLPRPVPVLEELLLRLIRDCTVVIPMGRTGAESLLRHGVSPDQVEPVPPSFDEERFRRSNNSASNYDLVTVGALIPTKQTSLFLHAVAQLRQDRPGLRAAIVGEGPEYDRLRDLARLLRVDDAVSFLGFREDVERIHLQSKIFVLTSRHEGLSVALTEAMACGLPAVVPAVGDLSDLVVDGRNGFLVQSDDGDEFVRRIGCLLDDDSLRARLGCAAASDAVAHSGRNRVSSLYRRLLRNDWS